MHMQMHTHMHTHADAQTHRCTNTQMHTHADAHIVPHPVQSQPHPTQPPLPSHTPAWFCTHDAWVGFIAPKSCGRESISYQIHPQQLHRVEGFWQSWVYRGMVQVLQGWRGGGMGVQGDGAGCIGVEGWRGGCMSQMYTTKHRAACMRICMI